MAHEIALLALHDVVVFDLGVVTQIFGAARDVDDRPLYRVRTCTPDGEPVRTSAGFLLTPGDGPDILGTADTVIVAGVHGGTAMTEGRLEPYVAGALARRRPDARLISICTGAFVLAAAGVLDGRRAATHWWHADRFCALYPRVRLDAGVLFVDDGDVLSSAGVGAGIDLCLHVVRHDHGSEAANRAARRSVVPPWRDGGQSQFIERPLPDLAGASTAPTRAWALERLHEPLALPRLAARAGMSVRTFTRRFREETGVSPAQWLLRQRVEEARRLLETTDLPIDRVAERAGFGTATSMRQHLHAAVGVSPTAYRKTFSRTG
ncbi:MAG TPA: helix-turn-helix domain-containing protein [Actinoallomurus sp.]|jgi:transcriptional regulator GlxA family with amidase domain|nr:helix-turn-helix domain-containing protein [Actinoallomurus sp.]